MLIVLAASVSPSLAQEQPQNQAGIVIRHGDGSVSTSCVTFSEPSISGVELLQRGYTRADVDKILHGNWLRLMQQALTT